MKSHWSDKAARKLDGLDILVYTSRLIGAEGRLVVWGGGNSSVKVFGTDHTGKRCRILWIKGSGSDMKTITHKQFSPLILDDLLALMKRPSMSDEEMVDYQSRSVMLPGAAKPSIETLLHAFLPPKHIYHTHADAICALTDTPRAEFHLEKVFGRGVGVVPYRRPGFELAKLTGEAYARRPGMRAIVLDKHGLVTWAETAREAYLETIRMVTQAENYIRGHRRRRSARPSAKRAGSGTAARRAQAGLIAPLIRGGVSRGRRMILCYDDSPGAMRFVDHPSTERLSQIGPFTPDHLLHTKPWPLYLKVDAAGSPARVGAGIERALEDYRRRYTSYFERYSGPKVRMLDPNPRVILVPGVGMFTTGKDRRASVITRDLYRHTMEVIESSAAIEAYRSLSKRDLCDFEYWPLENFKLTLLPPEKEMSRRIALVTGAAGGIGRAIARRLAAEGAMVALTDLDLPKTRRWADAINEEAGDARAVAVRMDVTSEKSVRSAFDETVLNFGGLDLLVSNAGVARASSVEKMRLKDWDASMEVNATGHLLVCREAMRIFQAQGIGGAVVVVSTKNVLAPGKDFGAYSASKAAQVQLSRILAIEGAASGVRVNMINPDGIFESSGLWTEAVRKERARSYGIPVSRLEEYYAQRNLMKARVTADDVAEAALFLASDRSSRTTGAMLPVDGGLREAFPR